MIREQLIDALTQAASAEGLDIPAEIGLEQPANREHGDWSSNLALATSKQAGTNPRELAGRLVERLEAQNIAHVRSIEIAGPGFVNVHLAETWLHDVLAEVIELGPKRFLRNASGGGRSINVEFVSANPTGPLHAGHGRGAVFGDALAELLTWNGWNVTRETYINDRGVQMQTYAASLAARAAGEEPPVDGYQGQYVIDWAAEMPPGVDALQWGQAHAMEDQREVLGALGIEFDVWFSEKTLVENGSIERALGTLRDRDMVFDDDGAVWLRSTDFGDDKDRVLVKSDGEFTYLTPDIAYHDDKFRRSEELVNVWGADHHGYVARMKAAMGALGHESEALDVQITQLVKLMRDGEEVRLSKRSGDIVELRDVVDEVGADATRFTYLLQSIDSQQTFDLAVAASQAMDNPVFTTQYAHARLCQIAKRAVEQGVERRPLADVDLSLLVHDREIELLRTLFAGPAMVELAGRERAPHRVVGWVRELAASVHSFYQNKECYVVGDSVSPELTQARLWLVESARIGLAAGLSLVGVSAPEQMWADELDTSEEE
ncbi:MAG: arginine--tRNA ligase [Acidimicrobiales bacterium]